MHALPELDNCLRPGAEIDRYVVEQVLGEGGTSVVYLVRHRRLGTHYALKLLHQRSHSLVERLLREATLQSRLQHPHIVHVLDVVEHNTQPGLLMEFIDGPSLEQLLAHRRLDLAQVDRLAEHMLAGVEHAHREGIVHRDLKPANVLLSPRGGQLVAKVCDFGIAKTLDPGGTTTTRTGCKLGTPQYMSPEQLRDAKRVDQRTDVYALGTMLYEMVAGVHPFAGERDAWVTLQRIAAGHYNLLEEVAPHAPERMHLAVKLALKPNPEDRVGTVSELRALWSGDSQRFVLGWEDDLLATAEELSPKRVSEQAEPIPVHPLQPADTQAPTLVLEPDPERAQPLWRSLLIAVVGVAVALGLVAFGAFLSWSLI